MPAGQVINKGIGQLARDTGLSPTRITQLMKKGMTPDEIRKRGRVRAPMVGRVGKGSTIAKEQAQIKVAADQGRTYVPPRLAKRTRDAEIAIARGSGRHPDPAIVRPAGQERLQPTKQSNGMLAAPEYEQGSVEQEVNEKIRLTSAQANEREIIVAQKAGQLVTIATVNNWFAESIIKARDMLLRLSGEMAERLAAEEDPVQVKIALQTEINRVLNVLKLMGREGVPVDVE